jgi:hypothetical protein
MESKSKKPVGLVLKNWAVLASGVKRVMDFVYREKILLHATWSSHGLPT